VSESRTALWFKMWLLLAGGAPLEHESKKTGTTNRPLVLTGQA
jgi:hypothetical protein